MAERRMFAKTIIDSDAFLEMPISSQCLYFHLAMRADDEGFINKPKTIMKMIGSKDDDMNVLISRKFIIPFESGIVVIKHWKIHNYISKDRFKETKYQDEKYTLLLDENNAYTTTKNDLYTECIQPVYKMETQVRLGKDRLGNKKEIYKEKYGEFKNVLLSDEEYQKLQDKFTDYQDRIEKLSAYIASKGKKYSSHYATILSWSRKDEVKEETKSKWKEFS